MKKVLMLGLLAIAGFSKGFSYNEISNRYISYAGEFSGMEIGDKLKDLNCTNSRIEYGSRVDLSNHLVDISIGYYLTATTEYYQDSHQTAHMGFKYGYCLTPRPVAFYIGGGMNFLLTAANKPYIIPMPRATIGLDFIKGFIEVSTNPLFLPVKTLTPEIRIGLGF